MIQKRNATFLQPPTAPQTRRKTTLTASWTKNQRTVQMQVNLF